MLDWFPFPSAKIWYLTIVFSMDSYILTPLPVWTQHNNKIFFQSTTWWRDNKGHIKEPTYKIQSWEIVYSLTDKTFKWYLVWVSTTTHQLNKDLTTLSLSTSNKDFTHFLVRYWGTLSLILGFDELYELFTLTCSNIWVMDY